MNQVDIYIGDYRLDLFQDEEISINLSVQNIQDLSKIFTDFTQTFTIPASGINNEIFKHYYRTDVDASRITTSSTTNYPIWNDWLGVWETQLQTWGGGSSATSVANNYDFRLRVAARIEINSIPFRTGVIEMESVLLKGTEPYSYAISFYGDLVSLSDLFGEDYLYDLDLSAYDHAYDGATILQGFTQDALFGGEIFYPLMSPVRNWVYNVSSSSDPRHEDDIQFVTGHSGHHHGIHYNELKPAIKVVKLFEAIEAKYGISFTGNFMSDTQFNKLFLWAHRFEGYLYDSTTAIEWQLINFNRNTGSGSQFNLTTDTWTVASTHEYQLRVQVLNPSANYELGLFRNGVQVGVGSEDAVVGTNTTFFDGYIFSIGDEIQLKIRPKVAANMTYQVSDYTAYTATDGIPDVQQFEVDQTAGATYSFQLAMSPLMPEIKVKDFVAGIMKMHNLVIQPTSATSFNVQTLDDWYTGGTNQDLTSYINIAEVSVNRPPLHREISFDYQDTEQILGYEYQRTNTIGFGNLNSIFSWDGDVLNVDLPFECPLFERLTDIDTGDLTNILVYKSQTREFDTDYENRFQKYVGAPVLMYGEFSLDISANPIAFVDEADAETQIDQVWYANTSSTSAGVGLAYTLTWGSDIDPYYLESIGKSLYQTYWEDYITDLYNVKRRLVQVEGILPLGKIVNFNPKNKIIWNNQRWIVNSADINMTTGRVRFELLNDV